MLIEIWTVDWNNRLNRMNMKMGEDNGKALVMVNGKYQNFSGFQAMNFERILFFLFQLLPLVLWD